MGKFKNHVMVCAGTTCQGKGSDEVMQAFRKNLEQRGLGEVVHVVQTGCFGMCGQGPTVHIPMEGTYYQNVGIREVAPIIKKHFGENPEMLPGDLSSEGRVPTGVGGKQIKRKQIRIALRNCGFIDPENIQEAIACDAYQALGMVLTRFTPADAIDEVKKSGLRGRGGGGFPTGLKWEIGARQTSDQKYVVCNADEGDPGAFMDRSILEGDPHSVLEAMAICGFCIGSDKGLIYIRAEYPLAIERLKIAMRQARELGLLGNNILNTGFNFDIELRYGAGAFVCGEETSLIHSMEGLRGEPTVKPPFPAESGYLGKPTIVNNVETYANVPAIFLKGAAWFSSIGTEKSKGTKVFALAGKINNVGLIEVPMGTTLREIIYEIGGGIKGGKEFKAIQTGGPSGGCLTAEHLDIPIDYDNLVAAGSMMGSGGMIVMDQDDCMVSIARYYLDFTVEESCGKCSPCRIGNKRLFEILETITKGEGTMDDLSKLRNLSQVIRDTSLCGLGQTSPNPVVSTMENFMEEYLEHVVDHKCRAGQCKSMMRYVVVDDNCVGCTACARNCPVNAISGERKKVHVIDQNTCIKCGACLEKCKFSAIEIK